MFGYMALRPATTSSSVDFPAPDAPINAHRLPGASLKLIPYTKMLEMRPEEPTVRMQANERFEAESGGVSVWGGGLNDSLRPGGSVDSVREVAGLRRCCEV